jgi:predicted dehydrogenase
MSLGLALFGYGGIGRLHAVNYVELPYLYPGSIPRPELRWVCTSREATATAARSETGALHAGTGWDDALVDPEVRAVDVSLPNHLHREAITAALAAGKHVYCEKPLAGSLADAEAIGAVVRASDRVFAMTFQYRFVPAILRARVLVDSGALGRVYSFRAEYLHSGYQDRSRPLSWRMRRDEGGSGALGDLGSHVIDLVRYLLGEFSTVQGHLETFIDQRPVSAGATELGEVTVDDAAWIRARLASGAVGTIEASRFATGTLDDVRLWVYGEEGAIHFSLMDPSFLHYFDARRPAGAYGGERGWQRIETVQQYPGARTPPGRAPIGWIRTHAENQYRFLRAVAATEAGRASIRHGAPAPSGRQPAAFADPEQTVADRALPGIDDALAVQRVLDATERSHAAGGGWTAVI